MSSRWFPALLAPGLIVPSLIGLNAAIGLAQSPTATASKGAARAAAAAPVFFDANAAPNANGVVLKSAGDGTVTFSNDCGGPPCDGRNAVKVSDFGYMYFAVDDGYIDRKSTRL